MTDCKSGHWTTDFILEILFLNVFLNSDLINFLILCRKTEEGEIQEEAVSPLIMHNRFSLEETTAVKAFRLFRQVVTGSTIHKRAGIKFFFTPE